MNCIIYLPSQVGNTYKAWSLSKTIIKNKSFLRTIRTNSTNSVICILWETSSHFHFSLCMECIWKVLFLDNIKLSRSLSISRCLTIYYQRSTVPQLSRALFSVDSWTADVSDSTPWFTNVASIPFVDLRVHLLTIQGGSTTERVSNY